MSDILIGQSYYLRFDPKLWAAMQPYPPLGSLYAASLLRAGGYDIAFFDAMLAESEQAWDEALRQASPRIAVIYEDNFNYLSKMCLLRMRQAAFAMIEMAKRRGCTVVLCGADASDHAGAYLAHGADFVLQGEGEYTLRELAACLLGRADTPVAGIAGLIYWPPGANAPLHTPRRQAIRNLDTLPFPAWDLADIARYRDIWLRRHGCFSLNMVTSRGCPYHCNWCAKPIWGQRYNNRSPENVAAEMKWLQQSYNPDHIWFMDDIFGLKPGWLAAFAAALNRLDCGIPFKCLSRADLLLRAGDIEWLRRAGCRLVWVGAESGSQKVLDAMEKGIRVDQIHAAAELLHRAGIRVGFFLQFGYPGEARSDIERTLQLVRDCRPDEIGMSVSYPMPGTRFYEDVRRQLGARQNWQDSSDMAMLYRGPFNTSFYRQLHVVLHHEFRARRYSTELKSLLRHPKRLRPAHLRRLAVMVFYSVMLPFERLRLRLLERQPRQVIEPPPMPLTNEQAAVPSPQPEAP